MLNLSVLFEHRKIRFVVAFSNLNMHNCLLPNRVLSKSFVTKEIGAFSRSGQSLQSLKPLIKLIRRFIQKLKQLTESRINLSLLPVVIRRFSLNCGNLLNGRVLVKIILRSFLPDHCNLLPGFGMVVVGLEIITR